MLIQQAASLLRPAFYFHILIEKGSFQVPGTCLGLETTVQFTLAFSTV